MSQITPPVLGSGAELSADLRYRWKLSRRWGPGGTVNFIMLNPSTADALVDDPTIRRCVRFARDWGHGGLVVTNLYGWRATDPRELSATLDPVGSENDGYINGVAATADVVVCAWGARGGSRAIEIAKRLAWLDLRCLGVTKEGHPRHPLYVPAGVLHTRYPPTRTSEEKHG